MARATKSAKVVKYRVYRIDESLRSAVTRKRTAENVTTKTILDTAVTACLPKLVKTITSVMKPQGKATRPCRWPVDEELLGALRVASKVTGVPASRLLLASVAMLTQKKGAK